MQVSEGLIKGSYIIDLDIYKDERGLFYESYNQQRYSEAGLKYTFIQDNRSVSYKNVVRGLHYQIKNPIGHLITVVRGRIFDVGLDLRKNSITFGQIMEIELSEASGRQVFFPPGVAHGFCSLDEVNEIWYKCTNVYYPGDEGGVLWNDPALNIPWPLKDPVIKSRDAQFPLLKDIPLQLLPQNY